MKLLRPCLFTLLCSFAGAQNPAGPSFAKTSSFEIRGILLDAATLQPIPKALVGVAPVTNRGNAAEFTTGDDGHFHFSGLQPGKYTLTAQRRGYLTESLNQHEAYSSAVVVGPAIDSSNIVFRLPPEAAISGIVVDEAGEAVRDAQVMLFSSGVRGGMGGTRRAGQTTTDDQGTYHFGHLPPGQYLVAVSARVWYAQRPQPKRQIIRMTLSDGTSTQFTTVGGFAPSQPKAPSADTSPPDEPSNPLDVVYPITFYAGTTEPSEASPIALKQGEKYVADISLQPVPALHLRFQTGSSGPQQNRFVTLEEKLFDGVSVPIPSETRIDASGDMALVGVPPGHYTARIVEQGRQQEAALTEIDAVSSGPVRPSDVNGAQVTVFLQLDPGTERPTQSYFQLFNMKTRDYFNQAITAKGDIDFKQPIPPGTYELAITNGRGEFIRNISASGAKVFGRTVNIMGTSPVRLKVALGRGMGEVTGTVLRDGKPFAGAMVALVPSSPGDNAIIFRRDQSDADGTFTLAGAIPGKYTVVAIENGWDMEWLNPQVLQPYLTKGTSLEVLPDGKYDVKVSLQ